MSPNCHSRRAHVARPARHVLTLDDALEVLTTAVGPEPGVACLLLDTEHRLLTCLDVTGAADADAVLDVVEVLLTVADQESELASVVLACRRPGHAPRPADGEICCYYELQDVFADAGLDLLDWVLVTERGVSSFATLTGSGGW